MLNGKLSYNSTRGVFLNVHNLNDLISFSVFPNVFHKNHTICIYLIIFDNVVHLSIPHLLADLPPPLSQLEVEEHIFRGEVVFSRHHSPGDDVTGGQGGPVADTQYEGVPLSST